MFDLGIFPDFLVNSYIARILFAALLGALIGLERDIRGRSAGLRTNILVSVGSSVFMLLSIGIAEHYSSTGEALMQADPTRIAAQIITGIGFLGAGAIIKYRFSVQGLTTAACLWTTSAIGMCCGSGFYDMGILATLIAIFVLTVLNRAEKLYSKDNYRIVKITAHKDTEILKLTETFEKNNTKVLHYDIEKNYAEGMLVLTLEIKFHYKETDDRMSQILIRELEKTGITIYRLTWRHQ